MRIGELSARSGVDAATIRYYESVDVLPMPRRTATGYRDYDSGDLDRLRFVKQARSLAIPLHDIRQIVELRDGGTAPCAFVREVLARESVVIDERIKQLELLQAELVRLTELTSEMSDNWPDGPCICHAIEESNASPIGR